MLSLLASAAFSDVTLQVDSFSVRAHKAILVHHSPVFTAMFVEKPAENKFALKDTSAAATSLFLT